MLLKIRIIEKEYICDTKGIHGYPLLIEMKNIIIKLLKKIIILCVLYSPKKNI